MRYEYVSENIIICKDFLPPDIFENVQNDLIKHINMDVNFVIEEDYKQSSHYQLHDFSNKNTVPNKFYQIHLAKYINEKFLRLYGLEEKLERFDA